LIALVSGQRNASLSRTWFNRVSQLIGSFETRLTPKASAYQRGSTPSSSSNRLQLQFLSVLASSALSLVLQLPSRPAGVRRYKVEPILAIVCAEVLFLPLSLISAWALTRVSKILDSLDHLVVYGSDLVVLL
jgi:hypothetical protein